MILCPTCQSITCGNVTMSYHLSNLSTLKLFLRASMLLCSLMVKQVGGGVGY